MDITYSEKAKESGEFTLLQQATNRLEEAVGQSPEHVTVQWDRFEDDKGRSLYTLQLKDYSGEVTRKFSIDELQSPERTSFRIYRLWGDLLQLRTEKQLEALVGRRSNGEN
jgi:hypothetical protein